MGASNELPRIKVGKEHYPKILEILERVSRENRDGDEGTFLSNRWSDARITNFPEFNIELKDGGIIGWKDAHFENVHFVDDWHLAYLSLDLVVRFSNCQFKLIRFINCRLHGMRFESVVAKTVGIELSAISETSINGSNIMELKIRASATHSLNLINLNLREIEIENSVGHSFDISNMKLLMDPSTEYLSNQIKLVNTIFCHLGLFKTFEFYISVQSSVLSHFTIQDCGGPMRFEGCHIYSFNSHGEKNSIQLENCSVGFVEVIRESNRLVLGKTEVNTLLFRKLTLPNSAIFELRECEFGSVSITDSLLNGRVWFYSVKFAQREMPFLSAYLQFLEEKLLVLKRDEILNLGSSDKKLIYSEFDKASQSVIEHTDTSMLGAAVFLANTKLVEGGIFIGHSDLGSSGIFGCDFSQVETTIIDSDISKIKLGNSQFQSSLFFEDPDFEKVLRTRIEYLVQLKAIHIAKGDTYLQSKYSQLVAKEQESLYWFRAKKNKRVSDVADYLVHILNRISNQHGESYLRALLFFGITTWVLYAFYLFSLGFRFSAIDDSSSWHFLGDYFVFIDPTHRSDFLQLPLTSWSKPLDFLSRIVVAFCIYQFVAAFRKNTRKP